ncbi:MAG: sulfite exporter TauE/SafE family protein [Saprospiraceae bacterium]|nr:sulfite exporter TauE/SafE family protein [Saprospiraceae bacterium]
MCNIVVVTGACWVFYQSGHLKWKAVFPLLASGIPMAFLGAYWRISDATSLAVLGISLVVAGLSLLLPAGNANETIQEPKASPAHYLLGGATGLLSGMVGIGGGIFLAPILYKTRWGNGKHIAAASSVFIFFNSIAGLGGQFARNHNLPFAFALPLMFVVLLGGQLGSRWAIRKSAGQVLRQITGALVAYAGINLLIQL